jgi:transposase-like protein
MFALLRVLVVPLIGLVVFAIIRTVIRSMQQSRQDALDTTMPYCQKCESNRHVVVNAGQSLDVGSRWYCTHCREGF